MRRNKSWLFVLVILTTVVGLFLAVALWAAWTIQRPPVVASNSIIELSVGGSIPEMPSQNPLTTLFKPDDLTVFDLWQLFDYARKDTHVSAIYLEIEPLAIRWAQIEEIRDAIKQFRESGKQVHVFLAGDMSGEAEFYLASAADTITINPDSTVLLNGLLANFVFYKRSLEKLGIHPDFIQFKEFKSPEVYERETLTPQIRSMMTSILEELEERFLTTVSADRSIDPEVLSEIIRSGIMSGRAALDSGLVDRAGYRHEVLAQLASDADMESFRGTKPKNYLRSARARFKPSGTRVALVAGNGVIISGKSDPFSETLGGTSMSKTLRSIRNSGRYEAVLFRVNSPGGSVVGSDMIWREVQLLEEAGIPVIVSMSGVAGSGGYYIAMAASRIISQPSTITGSIGVIFGKFDVQGLLDWLGMSVETIETSPNADLFSPFTSLTTDQRRKLTDWISQVYERFVSKAAQGRHMEFSELESSARGRIYTGTQAKELGLVDDVGGFPKALDSIRDALDLEAGAPIRLVQFPRAKGVWEALSDLAVVRMSRATRPMEWLRNELLRLDEGSGVSLLMPEIEIR